LVGPLNRAARSPMVLVIALGAAGIHGGPGLPLQDEFTGKRVSRLRPLQRQGTRSQTGSLGGARRWHQAGKHHSQDQLKVVMVGRHRRPTAATNNTAVHTGCQGVTSEKAGTRQTVSAAGRVSRRVFRRLRFRTRTGVRLPVRRGASVNHLTARGSADPNARSARFHCA
jgi:hypothetical protein